MDLQHENRFNYFGRAVFAFLFFLLVYASSAYLNKSDGRDSSCKFISELKSNTATIKVEVQQFYFSNSPFHSVIDKSNFKLFNYGGLKLISDNKTIKQEIIFHQRDVFLIPPIILQRFYRQYHSKDTDDFLI